MLRLLAVLSLFAVLTFLVGCSAGVPATTAATAELVEVENSFSSIQAGSAPVQLTALLANASGNQSILWSLTLANVDCSPSCGTLAAQGMSALYTPPATEPLNHNATISATLASNKAALFAFDFSITPPISVTITNKLSRQLAGAPAVTLDATVSNDSANAGVTWTLTAGGSNCSPACGTLTVPAAPSFTATYTPPITAPAGADASPTITAASVTRPAANDTSSFSIIAPVAVLQGNYAFLLRGYDGNGLPLAVAGSIEADGNGAITDGELDMNADGGITQVPSPLTGNYSVDPSSGVARAIITITSYSFPNTNIHFALSCVVSTDGTRGRAIEFDGSGFLNSGTILQQDSKALSAANPAGTYAFGLDSDAPVGGRTVAAGQLVLTSSSVTGGLIDQSKADDPTPAYSATSISGGTVGTPDSSGRGTLSLTVSGDTTHYAYYIVSSNQLNLIQLDHAPTFGTVFSGTAQTQQTLTAGSVNTTSVLEMTGMDVVPATKSLGPDVIIGIMTISGGNTFNLTFDENDVGTIFIAHPTGGTVASFDPNTGRGVLSAVGGFNSGFVNTAVFYLYDTGQGFIIDADPSTNNVPPSQAVTNNAFSGRLIPQASGPFSAQSVSGNLLAAFGGSAIPQIPNLASAFNFTGAAGTYDSVGDLTSTVTQGANVPNFSFNGTWSVADPVLGRGTTAFLSAVFGTFNSNQFYPASFYLIGPNQFVSIGTQSGAYSGISFFDPQ